MIKTEYGVFVDVPGFKEQLTTFPCPTGECGINGLKCFFDYPEQRDNCLTADCSIAIWVDRDAYAVLRLTNK